eukprot:886327-Prorocentrum_minimum.AAC.1
MAAAVVAFARTFAEDLFAVAGPLLQSASARTSVRGEPLLVVAHHLPVPLVLEIRLRLFPNFTFRSSITSFYGSLCANNGKDALNTPVYNICIFVTLIFV